MYQLDNDSESAGEINLVPMIDVVFSILAFFIIASLFLTRAEGIDVKLPKATTTQTQTQRPVSVGIDRQGNVFVDNEAVPIVKLRQQLEVFRKSQAPLVVIVRADTKVEHGLVVAVMDELRQIPNSQLAIATQKPQR
ncbi:MAG: biopolymer transporter ExbD [Gloeomargaritaceae cyanobacterium C42_A2020_066]|nr:biopolymer transporter ExbD [Gloeomargaritaceae cyanobacterium C42_A2020_066]